MPSFSFLAAGSSPSPSPFAFKSLHPLPPTDYPSCSVAIPSTTSLSSLPQYIPPFDICQPSLLAFIPPSLLYHPLTILHHLLHPKWSHCKLLLPSWPKLVCANKHTPLQTSHHPAPLHIQSQYTTTMSIIMKCEKLHLTFLFFKRNVNWVSKQQTWC